MTMIGTKLLLLSFIVYVSGQGLSYYGTSNVRNQSRPPPRTLRPRPVYQPGADEIRPVYNPQPVYQPPQPVYQPPQPAQPTQPVYQPPQPNLPPSDPQPIYEPPQPVYQPPQPIYQPAQPLYQPQPSYQPPRPEQPATDPQPVYQPPQPVYQPQPRPDIPHRLSPIRRPPVGPPIYGIAPTLPAPVAPENLPQPISLQPAIPVQPAPRPRPIQPTDAPAEGIAPETPATTENIQINYPESTPAPPNYDPKAVDPETPIDSESIPGEKPIEPLDEEVPLPSSPEDPNIGDNPLPSTPEPLPELTPPSIPEEPLTDPIPEPEQPTLYPVIPPEPQPTTLEPVPIIPDPDNQPITPSPPEYTPVLQDPSTPIQPMQPPRPIQPMQPPTPMQPVQPPRPIQPMQPPRPIQPMQPSTPIQPMQPSTPIQPMQPYRPIQPMQPSRPIQPMQPPKPIQPVQPSRPNYQPTGTLPTYPLFPPLVSNSEPYQPHPDRPSEPGAETTTLVENPEPNQPTPRPTLWSTPYPIVPSTPGSEISLIIPMTDFQCSKGNGYYTIINECDTYIECQSRMAYKHTCPNGLHFNPRALYPEYPCAYPSEVQCESTALKQDPRPTNECPNRYGFFSLSGGDCSKYIMCQEGKATLMNCPFGLVFNEQLSSCDWPENVPQCNPDAFKDFTCPIPPADDPDLLTRYRYGSECGVYVACQRGHPRLLKCDAGLSFDENSQVCIDSDLIPECA